MFCKLISLLFLSSHWTIPQHNANSGRRNGIIENKIFSTNIWFFILFSSFQENVKAAARWARNELDEFHVSTAASPSFIEFSHFSRRPLPPLQPKQLERILKPQTFIRFLFRLLSIYCPSCLKIVLLAKRLIF